MKQIPYSSLRVTGGFWADMQKLCRDKTVWAVYDRFYETGRIPTMDCSWQEGMPNKPHIFWGSDVVKWMEGAAYILSERYDEALWQKVDSIIRDIEKGTTEDGYYNSYYNTTGEERFTGRSKHELYSLGHMIEAAIAIYQFNGDERLLNVCKRNLDLVDRVFRVEQSAGFVTPGHEEIELALMRLYHLTKEEKYLRLCAFFLDQRGNNQREAVEAKYPEGNQSHKPVREQDEAVGHSVRAVYLYCGMIDAGLALKDEGLIRAAEKLFDNIYNKKMYITGGIGALSTGEQFSSAYHLPNVTAYTETCAALGLGLFAGRMSDYKPDGRYGDAVERILYNGMISGLSMDGEAFFYENPLAMDKTYNAIPQTHTCMRVRQKVFGCSCCPPNLVRFIPSVANWICGTDDEYVYIHQYIACEGVKDLPLTIRTVYPKDGFVSVSCPGRKLALRRPAWCRTITCEKPYSEKDGYLYFDCDSVEITFEMKPVFMTACSEVYADRHKTALMRGPVVYCLEDQDQDFPLSTLSVDPNGDVTEDEDFGFFPRLTAHGFTEEKREALYQPYTETRKPCKLHYIPYHTFANRGEDDMIVWAAY